jgi:hypothetical protein
MMPERWQRLMHQHTPRKGTLTMKLLNLFKSFQNDEAGAVTVDWVVLTAALVGLGMAVIATLSPAIDATADVIVTDLNTAATR